MSVDDAIDEMEQIGHNFFVYRDMESDQIQVRTLLSVRDLFACKQWQAMAW